MVTVAQIAAKAFTAVSAKIPDAVHAATLTRTVQGTYNPSTGEYTSSTTSQTGRAVVDTATAAADVFPAYVVGPADQLILLEGFTSCTENDKLAFAGQTMTVKAVQDIVAAGTLFFVIAS